MTSFHPMEYEFKEEYRFVFQLLLFKYVAPTEKLRDFLMNISETNTSDLELAIKVINYNVKRYRLQVDIRKCEFTGESWTFLTLTGSSAKDMKIQLEEAQQELLYKIMDKILTSYGGMISSIDAENLGIHLKSGVMNASQTQNTLQHFLKKSLLSFDKGFFTLAPRLISQMEPYLKDQYNINECYLCKNIVIVMERCPNCDITMHRHCFAERCRNNKQKKCPNCKNQW